MPNVREYYYEGELEPYGYSYERGVNARGDREFVFWSEARDGEQGMHFLYDINGKIYPIDGNPEMINPYDVNPISRIVFPYDASDVTMAALHSSIAFTEVNVGYSVSDGITSSNRHRSRSSQSKVGSGSFNIFTRR